MRASIKKACFAGMAAFALFLAYQFYDRQFKMGNIIVDWPPVEEGIAPGDDLSLLQEALNQPFTYLDRGKQSFVFASRDGKYVLKFFDTRCMRSGGFLYLFPINEQECQKKLCKMVEGIKTAILYDRDHNGIVYVQLAPNPSLKEMVEVVDKFGFTRNVDLAAVPFQLQYKAIPLRNLISSLLDKGKVEEANQRIEQIIDMYVDGYRRGVYDDDHNFMYNTGLIGSKPIRIDVGRLQYNEEFRTKETYLKDIQKLAVGRLGEWLQRHYPRYRQQMLDASEKKLDELSKSD